MSTLIRKQHHQDTRERSFSIGGEFVYFKLPTSGDYVGCVVVEVKTDECERVLRENWGFVSDDEWTGLPEPESEPTDDELDAIELDDDEDRADPDDDDDDETGPVFDVSMLDGTIPEIEKAVVGVTDPDHLRVLIVNEEGADTPRVGALAALRKQLGDLVDGVPVIDDEEPPVADDSAPTADDPPTEAE